MMKNLLLCGLLWSLTGAALAAYKCNANGVVTFSDQPCSAGRQTIVETKPAPAAADVRAAQKQLDQERKKMKILEAARHKREAQEDKARHQSERRAAAARKKCAQLAQRVKWADEDAASAVRIRAAERAKLKSRRAKTQYAQACAR